MNTQPNIIWITLDSVRGDRTTLGDYHRDTTPNMAEIAQRPSGTAFTQCISHGMWSLPSDATVLSGKYPAEHGAGMWNDALPEDIVTIPERLQDHGYRTVGISHNAYFSDATGLSRGFDQFEWVHRSTFHKTAGVWLLCKFLMQLRQHGGGYTAPLSRHRPEYLVTELANRHIRSLAGQEEPFFMFAHTQAAHLPYSPPLSHREDFTKEIDLPPNEAAQIAHDQSQNYYEAIGNGCDFDAETQDAIGTMYDGLVRYVDERVQTIFNTVQSADLGPTVFVVTADHGDLLGEQGVLGHQFLLHDGLVNVPLVVHGLDSLVDLPEDTLIQHADLMTALLSETGLPGDELEGMVGIDPREETRQFAVSQRGHETYEEAIEQVRQHNPDFNGADFQSGLLHAIRSKTHKLLKTETDECLYELPDERHDRIDDLPAVTRRHRKFFENELDGLQRMGDSADRTMSDAMREQLSDLGYVVD